MTKIRLNPDTAIVAEIREKLRETNGYCPCTPFRDETHKCMCKAFREQITEGLCHCGLYERYEKGDNH